MLLHVRSLDPKLLDTAVHDLADLLVIQNNACFQIFIIGRNTYVVFDGKTAEDTISTTVLCDQADTGFHGICRVFDRYFLSFDVNFTAL